MSIIQWFCSLFRSPLFFDLRPMESLQIKMVEGSACCPNCRRDRCSRKPSERKSSRHPLTKTLTRFDDKHSGPRGGDKSVFGVAHNPLEAWALRKSVLSLRSCLFGGHIASFQIPAKRGPASRFVVEANTEALVSKSNSRRSKYVMVRGH